MGDQEPVTDIVNGLQETFSREGLRQLIKAYESGVKLSTVRHALGGEHPLGHADVQKSRAQSGLDVCHPD